METDPRTSPTSLAVPLFLFFGRNAPEIRSSCSSYRFLTLIIASNKKIAASVQHGGSLQRLLASGAAHSSCHVSATRAHSGGNEKNETMPERKTQYDNSFVLPSSVIRGTLFTPSFFSSRSGIRFSSCFPSTLLSSWGIGSAAGGHGSISRCWISFPCSAEPEKDGDHVMTAPISTTVVQKSEGVSHFNDTTGRNAQERRYDSVTTNSGRNKSHKETDPKVAFYHTTHDASAKKGSASRGTRKKCMTSSLSSSSIVESVKPSSPSLTAKGSRKSKDASSKKSRGKTSNRTSLHSICTAEEGTAKEEANSTVEEEGSPKQTTTPHTYPMHNEKRYKEGTHMDEAEDHGAGVTWKEEKDEKNGVKSKQKGAKRKSSNPNTNTMCSSDAHASSKLQSHKENQNNNRRKASIRPKRLKNEQPESTQAPSSEVVMKGRKKSDFSYGTPQPTTLSKEKKRKNRETKEGSATVSHVQEEIKSDSSPSCSSSLEMPMTGKMKEGNVEETAISFCRVPDTTYSSARTLLSVREVKQEKEIDGENAAEDGRSQERRKEEEEVNAVKSEEREGSDAHSSSFSSLPSETAEAVFHRRHYSWGSIHRILREIRQRREHEESSEQKKSIPDRQESEIKLYSDTANAAEKESKDSMFLFSSTSPSFARLVRRPPPRPPRTPRPPFSSSPKGYEEKKWNGRPYGASPSFSNEGKPKYSYRYPVRKNL